MLGERHRIIANDWQAASMAGLTGRICGRAADILDDIDFTPAALRADLTRHGPTVGRLYSAAELIAHAADLASDSAGLVYRNERRRRTFRQPVNTIVATSAPTALVDL